MKKYINYPVKHYENMRDMMSSSARIFHGHVAFMEKRDGAYRNIFFEEFYEDAKAFGTALLNRGYAGKRIVVTGVNSYPWVVTYMAVMMGVGVIVPVDKEINGEELANIVNVSEAALVVYGEKQTEKVNQITANVDKICFTEQRDIIEEGKKLLAEGNTELDNREIDANALASLIFTSGTTGVSKGVMLSQRQILFNLEEMCQSVYIDEKDVFLSVLPLHHAYECTCGFLCQMYRGSTVAFSEGLRYISKNMTEVKPTMMLCVPLLLETLYKKIRAGITKQGMDKQVETLIKITNAIPNEKLRMATKRKVFAKIHASVGGRLRMFISGGAAVDPVVLRGLRDLGIHAIQGYGLTECAPLAALNRDTWYKDNSAGTNTHNTLLDIYNPGEDGNGEIRYKGGNIMMGYYQMPELTAETIRDGWFYTGDLGHLDEDGFLIITGRKKNVIVTYNGKNVFPEELETYLLRTPYVAETVVVGYINPKKKDYDIVALIVPNEEQLIADFGKDYTPEQVDKVLTEAVATTNEKVQTYKRLAGYLLRTEPFPKNSSQKIKRAGVADSQQKAYTEKFLK